MTPDIDLLQGTWHVSTLEVDGRKMADGMLSEARIQIKGHKFISTGMGAEYKGTLELDATTNPRRINMKFDAGPEKGNSNLAIYKLDGDSWTMCIATHGTVRPSGFATQAGSGFALETLTRGKEPVGAKKKKSAATASAPAAAPAAARAHANTESEFEGEWQMVSAVMDGNPMEQSLTKWVKRVTNGNTTAVYAGPQLLMVFDFTYDPAASPKTIDYLNTAGSNKGKAQKGIYEFEKDLLMVCVAAPGHERPAEFRSVKGDKGTMTVWKLL